MAHPWENLVVSGVDKPRFLLVTDNFCNNPLFSSNLDGWSGSGGATLTRIEDFSAYRQWMCQADFAADTDYVEFTYDYGSVVQGKTFLFALNIVSSNEFTLKFYHSSEFGDELFDSQIYKKAFIVATAPDDGGTATTITIRIYGTSVNFDNVYFAEVEYDLEMPQPHDSGEILFEKENDGSGELWTGKIKEYNTKWIPNYNCEYFYLSEQNEQYRQRISEHSNVFCVPHIDFMYGFLGKWMKDEYVRDYNFRQYDGHSGGIYIKGQEYLNQELAIQLIVYYEVLVTAYVPE